MKTTRRGYLPEYEKYFNKENIELIKDAMVEVVIKLRLLRHLFSNIMHLQKNSDLF